MNTAREDAGTERVDIRTDVDCGWNFGEYLSTVFISNVRS